MEETDSSTKRSTGSSDEPSAGSNGYAARALVFGLISLGIHAAARVYDEMQKDAPEPEQATEGFEGLLTGFTKALQGISNLTDDMSRNLRILQAADLLATAFAILGVASAAIAGHRGDRGAAMWMAWIASVIGLFLWAGRIPLGWVI